jgi:superfamily I DNA/RNA helicase
MITGLKEKGLITSWKDVTVLGRNWGHLQSTAEAFREAGIPNIVLNEADIPDTKEVNVLLGAIRSCASPEDDLARDLVIDYLGEAGHGNPDVFDPYDLIDPSLTPVALLKKIRKFLGLDALLDTLCSDEKEHRTQAMHAFQIYCTKVAKLAPDLPSFSRLLTLEGHTDQGKEEEVEDAVNLMSIHTSKGTERRVIFILPLDAEIFPKYDIHPGTEQYEEERRVLYVSITRAEDYLYLVHCKNRPTWKGDLRRRDPSPLLLEIDQNLLNCITYP